MLKSRRVASIYKLVNLRYSAEGIAEDVAISRCWHDAELDFVQAPNNKMPGECFNECIATNQ